HSGLLLVRGTAQRRGPRATVVGTMAWDLEALAAARRGHGPEAVVQFLGASGTSSPETGELQWAIRMEAGAELRPTPTCGRSANLKALGYTSPGSPG
ncbi:MAG: error-prone polymerase, partial [Streptomyces sp.]|nr:error-prone polymerase [Streptomyces sp.]